MVLISSVLILLVMFFICRDVRGMLCTLLMVFVDVGMVSTMDCNASENGNGLVFMVSSGCRRIDTGVVGGLGENMACLGNRNTCDNGSGGIVVYTIHPRRICGVASKVGGISPGTFVVMAATNTVGNENFMGVSDG